MESVTILAPDESVGLDTGRLQDLCVNQGVHEAEETVCQTMEQVALLLAEIERRWRAEDWPGMRRHLRMLPGLSDALGMVALTRAGAAVLDCLRAGDSVALAATLARLLRVGERSLMAVWDRQDLII